jgi:hypothetical protein
MHTAYVAAKKPSKALPDLWDDGDVAWQKVAKGEYAADLPGTSLEASVVRYDTDDVAQGYLWRTEIYDNNHESGTEPLEVEIFLTAKEATRWGTDGIIARAEEVLEFNAAYRNEMAARSRFDRRQTIAHLGEDWGAHDRSAEYGFLSAEFVHRDRLTTLARTKDGKYTVIVYREPSDGESASDFGPRTLHIRTFTDRLRAIDFAEHMTLLGD